MMFAVVLLIIVRPEFKCIVWSLNLLPEQGATKKLTLKLSYIERAHLSTTKRGNNKRPKIAR